MANNMMLTMSYSIYIYIYKLLTSFYFEGNF